MQEFRLAAAWTAWRQHAARSASAKQSVLIAVARLQNTIVSKAWQSWRTHAVRNAELKQRLVPALAAKLKDLTWAAWLFWADWARRRAILRAVLQTAQLARRHKTERDSFAAWHHITQRKRGARNLYPMSYVSPASFSVSLFWKCQCPPFLLLMTITWFQTTIAKACS